MSLDASVEGSENGTMLFESLHDGHHKLFHVWPAKSPQDDFMWRSSNMAASKSAAICSPVLAVALICWNRVLSATVVG